MSLSALNHLKSELKRKKEDAEKKKRPLETHHLTPLAKVEQEDESNKDTKKLPELNAEEEEKAKKARDILEAKAKLYDSLSEGVHLTKNSNLYLVNFEQKAVEDFGVRNSSSTSTPGRVIDLAKDDKDGYAAVKEEKSGSSSNTSNEAQEMKNCSDKELLMKARNLSASALSSENEVKGTFEPTLISPDMQREKMRQKWEEDEKLARAKDDIHYQDILFDEVRSHGVGYFAFSKDEDERRRQQAELEEMRKETLRKQEEFRKMRGDTADDADSSQGSQGKSEQVETGKELTDEEKLKKIEEALRAIRREVHVREWDKGKEIPVMSQEEWIEKKRNERDNDFAPPEMYFENPAPGKKHKRPILPSSRPTLFPKKTKVDDGKQSSVAEEMKSEEAEASLDSNSAAALSVPELASIPLPQDVTATASISHGVTIEETEPSPGHAAKPPKRSAMALLEQLQYSTSTSDEAMLTSERNVSGSQNTNSCGFPQNDSSALSSSQSSSMLSSIPLPPDTPTASLNVNNQPKRPFFIPSNLVPRKCASNIKQKLEKTNVQPSVLTTPSSVFPSPVKENFSGKKLFNPLDDPKLLCYFKEPEQIENNAQNNEPHDAGKNECSATVSSNQEELQSSVETSSQVSGCSSSSVDGSRIKLGNLIRNRPPPKSGMALLEEIKKSTRDFGPEVESSHNTPQISRKRGAEIAPPECLLHSTPQLPVRKKGLFSKKEEISNSISAGLQTLKSVKEKKKKTREKGLLDIL